MYRSSKKSHVDIYQCLNLRLPSSYQTKRNKFILFIIHTVYGILLQHPTQNRCQIETFLNYVPLLCKCFSVCKMEDTNLVPIADGLSLMMDFTWSAFAILSKKKCLISHFQIYLMAYTCLEDKIKCSLV